ncbi:hypothetical protein O3G_MSEX012119 [Manduca sexta]|nr:hypothetical protein O3G_MSEX012119 [Manduca sexta]
MERAQQLSDHAKAFDAVFFISSTKGDTDKGIYVVMGCERRPMGMCNGLFYIGLPGKGLLCSKKIPDTVLFGADIGEFGAEGIKIKPVEPMVKWNISYKGKMWYQNDPSKVVDVDFTGEWKATSRYFDFDSDLYPAAVVRSIAREKWSREYFEGLKTAHQSHYEQFGNLKCNFKIENESFEFTLPSFRDHSFGQRRDWSLMHRYAFHHIFLEDGTNMSVGVICQPFTASVFEAGWIALPNKEVYPIQWVDLKLYQHGEGGTAPKDYAFTFGAGDEEYAVQVLVEYESIHYVSDEWEARMVERFCKFTVNNTPGRGVSEFHYRHTDGRPESVAKDDPEWVTRRAPALVCFNRQSSGPRRSEALTFTAENRTLSSRMDFDAILEDVGPFGTYQKLVIYFVLLPAVIPCGFHAYAQLFMAANVKHWCRVPELEHIGNVDVIKNLSIPLELKNGALEYSECYMYNLNYSDVVKNYENAKAMKEVSGDLVQCTNGWMYDKSIYKSTVVTEWNLVCNRDFYPTLGLVLLAVGGIIGNYIFGYLQDTLGRKPSFFIYLLIECIFGVATAFAQNYVIWIIYRIGVGFTVPAIMTTPYVLAIELVGPRYRTLCTILSNIAYSLGLILLAGVVYSVRDWRHLALATMAHARESEVVTR